ncbi:MAG: hypothetical protein V2I33_13350 [Kangiellaceae bacterium]|jgi:hypothetical protein|nr:hypothetical protein [Kangiellaceae bacterium]
MNSLPITPPPEPHQLEIKDIINVYEKSGRIIEMTIVSYRDGVITGAYTDKPSQSVSVKIDDIERLEVETIDGVKTTFAIIGGIVVIELLIIISILGLAFALEAGLQ